MVPAHHWYKYLHAGLSPRQHSVTPPVTCTCLSSNLLCDVYCQQWHDPRLTWNADEVNNVGEIIVKVGDIWVPDIVLKNT